MFFKSKKNTSKLKLSIHIIPISKFNKTFISKYKNVLFVYDKESPLRDTKFKDKKNVLKFDLEKINNDGTFNKNKKIIDKNIKNIIKTAQQKNLKKIGLCASNLGYQIKSNSPRTYDYLKNKLRQLQNKYKKSIKDTKKSKKKSKKSKNNNSNSNSNNSNSNSNSNSN